MSAHPGWQKFEERVASVFGGRRRGAATSSAGKGKSDVIGADGWAVECKLLSRPGFQDCLNAALQAERNAATGEIPVAIVKRKGDHDVNALVVLRFETFQDWFVGQSSGEA